MFLSSSLPHLGLLLVEDDEDDYVITRDLLDDLAAGQYELDWARTAAEARRYLAKDAHHLCLMDYRLGGDDGLALLAEAPRLGFTGPIIMLTGQDEREVDVRALRLGAVDYLVKSQLTSATLARAIRYAVARHETEMERAERLRAEAENRSKSEFLARLSHELRTPLTAILGYTDLMLSGDPSAETRARLQVVKRNGSHLLGLLNDVLDLSKIEAGRLEIEQQEVDLAGFLADLRSLLLVSARDKNLVLAFGQEGDVPRKIRTDPLRFRQILINLVSNAIKFTDVGRVEVTVRPRALEERELLEVLVRDTGCGISARDQKRLFVPFTRVGELRGDRQDGSGLGLAISRQLALRLGGDLSVESEMGQGSTFAVTIDPGDLTGVERGWLSRVAKPESARASTLSLRGRVLVADDLADIRELIGYIIHRAGAEVHFAADGAQVVASVEEASRSGKPFDLVLMDVQMPALGGLDATRRLRTRGVDVPIIALTAATMSGERERCLDAGCNEHLSKPVDEEVLLKAARRYLEERPVRVLLVEDDPDARSATAELLTLLGCHVRAAGNGEKALALAAEHAAATEIAFVDLTLPDMDGYRLIETLRAAGMQQTRFFSLSGREADEARAMACGVERHLLKPVGVSIIRGVLDSVR